MTGKINDGGPAFPSNASDAWGGPTEGMTLRDWFAGQALAGLCAGMPKMTREDIADGTAGGRFYVQAAFALADAMLAARAKQ